MTAEITVPDAVRDRLKTFGHAGMSDSDILVALMDRVQREDFVRELRKQHASTPRRRYVKLEDL